MPNDGPLVAVIDDDEATCRAVERCLAADGYRVRTYTTARAYLDESGAACPACLLVDLRMPDLDGLALVRAMRDGGGDVSAVFMTGTGDVPAVVEAMKEGALDMLAKPFSADTLRSAIARATDSARQLRDDRRSLADLWRLLARLTPREAEVCALVACGLLNKRVAALIGTKEKTVKVHRGRVMQKLEASSLAELVRLVDSVLAERARRIIKLDGIEIPRPRPADIVIDVMTRERAAASAAANAAAPTPESVDQRAMPRTR